MTYVNSASGCARGIVLVHARDLYDAGALGAEGLVCGRVSVPDMATFSPELSVSEEILLLAVSASGAAGAHDQLPLHGLQARSCDDVASVSAAILAKAGAGAGVVVISEERLSSTDIPRLRAAIDQQQARSDFPVVLLGRSRAEIELGCLIDDLLEVARVIRGRDELRRERVELEAALRQAASLVASRSCDHGVRLELKIADELFVCGDAVRLEQAFVKLLTHVLEYTPRGGRVVLEAARAGAGADMIEAWINEGVGARSERGVGSSTRDSEPIAALATHSQSSQSVGTGTTVSVTLPAAPAAALHSGPQASTGEPCHVVVIEDNDDARELLCELLRIRGHRVEAAADGELGVELVLATRPQAVIVDIGLPSLDGYGVAEAIRAALGEAVLLIALSGYGQTGDRERARAAGFDEHLTKPADPRCIARLLSARAAGRTQDPQLHGPAF